MKQVLLGAVFAVLVPGLAQATAIDPSDFTLNGSASVSGSSILLTPDSGFQSGSAFVTNPYAIDPSTTFSASFELDMTAGGAFADGLAFVVHNNPAGAGALGSAGGGLGYGGISNSVAVEFDTYANGSDPDNNHVGINQNGSVVSAATSTVPFPLVNSGTVFAWADYNGTSLDVFLSQTNTRPGSAAVSFGFDLSSLGPQAFFGFTAGTGGFASAHSVSSFDLTVASSVAPVPLPASLPLAAFGLAALGWLGHRRKSATA